MTSIYDDVFYVETLKDTNVEEREKICDCCSSSSDSDSDFTKEIKSEFEDDVIEILDCIYRKNMFEKVLKETLDELNQTKPCLEPGKYHMLCIYVNRYNKFITRIENTILWYEWRRLHKRQNKSSRLWDWSWKLMAYFNRKREPEIIEKMLKEKKND